MIDNFLKAPFHTVVDLPRERFMLLNSDVPKCVDQIMASKNSMVESPVMVETNTHLMPVECDQLIDCLEVLDSSMAEMLDILNTINNGKLTVVSNRYKLLMYLYSASDYVHSANNSVKQLRLTCMKPTVKVIQSQAKIQHELSRVAQACERIECEAVKFLDALFLNSRKTNFSKRIRNASTHYEKPSMRTKENSAQFQEGLLRILPRMGRSRIVEQRNKPAVKKPSAKRRNPKNTGKKNH